MNKVKIKKTCQHAYKGMFAIESENGRLLSSHTRHQAPRLYASEHDARQAANAIKWADGLRVVQLA